MAVIDPALPPIPQPTLNPASVPVVLQALIQRVNNLSSYVKAGGAAAVAGSSSASTSTTVVSAAASRFRFQQSAPATVWVITHGLNRNPSVEIADSAGTLIDGDVTYVSPNQVIVTFSSPFAGTADCN